jgi:MerR family transcriptional regulator, mercuric resistance operon regulatory protein
MGLTIGKLAHKVGVNVETIRYYQRVGLLKEPEKPAYGYRHYPVDDIVRIRFIKRAQQLGFTLKEIAELLSLGDGCCTDVRTLAEQKRDKIDQQIRDLQAMRKALNDLVEACQSDLSSSHCSLIDALSDQNESGS